MKFSNKEREYILNLHNEGKTIKQIADATGRNYCSIWNFLLFTSKHKPRIAYSPELIRKAFELRESKKLKWEVICSELGLKPPTFYSWRRRYINEQTTHPQK